MNRLLCAILLGLVLNSFEARAYVRGKNTPGALYFRTDYSQLTMLYSQDLAGGMLNTNGRVIITGDSDPVAALKAATEAWSRVDGSQVHFAPPAPTSLGNNFSDRIHNVVVQDTPDIRSIVGNAAGVTLLVSNSDGQLIDTDILLNPATMEQFGVPYSTTGNSGAIDLTSVLTHELGHALGAGHSPLMGATMYFQVNGFLQRTLSEDDKAFARSIAPAQTSTAAYGSISGSVILTGGLPGRGISVTAADRTSGVVVNAISDLTGQFRMAGVPSGNYIFYAEPCDGPTSLASLGLATATTDLTVDGNYVGGANTPRVVTVGAGTSEAIDVPMQPGTGLVNILAYLRGRANGTVDATGSSSPIPASRGETLDLMIGGIGITELLDGASIELVGAGASIVPGSAHVVTLAGALLPVVRFTVNITGAPVRSLVSVIYRVGENVTTVPGGLIVAATGSPLSLTSNGILNAASLMQGTMAPDSWVSLFGENLANSFLVSGANLATVLDGTSVQIVDSFGIRYASRLQFVANNQINFLMPQILTGPTRVTVTSPLGSSFVDVTVASVAPGIFAANANGRGPAASTYLTVLPNNTQQSGFTFATDRTPRVNTPIELAGGTQVYLIFYGTGLRNHRAPVAASIGGVSVPVLAAIAQGQYAGLDQINVGPLPSSLIGKGEVTVVFNIDGALTNPVTVAIK